MNDDILRRLENRHRWLLFAQHCYTCSQPEGICELGKLCSYGKKTLRHVAACKRDDCPYPRCPLLKPLLQHSRRCQVRLCNRAGTPAAAHPHPLATGRPCMSPGPQQPMILTQTLPGSLGVA